jgi:hypothetical protein
MAGRVKTTYPGVFHREVARIGGKGTEKEKVYYIVFKRDGRVIEEKVGYQCRDAMTPARAATFRTERIKGKRKSRKEVREEKKAQKEAEASRWTIDRLWEHYRADKGDYPSLKTDVSTYQHIRPLFAGKEPRDILPLDVDRLRHGLVKKGLAPQTIKLVLALLHRVINHGIKKGFCPGLTFKMAMPRITSKPRILAPSSYAGYWKCSTRSRTRTRPAWSASSCVPACAAASVSSCGGTTLTSSAGLSTAATPKAALTRRYL